MPLSKLSITNFRCFESLELSLSPGVNFFYGSNGSGKTSLLEAIYLFSSGKSFKSTNLAALIKHNNNKFSLKGYDGIKGDVIEINKIIDKPINVVLNNKKIAFYVFYVGLFGLSASIPVSKFGTSVGMFLLSFAWFLEWNWKDKLLLYKQNKLLLTLSTGLFLIFVFSELSLSRC